MAQQSGAGSPQQFCLRWNNYQTNLTNVFDQLLQSESFVDVTLACDGHSVKAHKMVLSACSPYFQSLFFDNPCQHPIVIMKDIKWPELKAAVEFMYKGEINVSQEQIGPLLKVAESLKIRGLADVNSEHELSSRAGLEDGINLASLQQHQQQQLRKKRRLGSGERSPSGQGSPEPARSHLSDEHDSVASQGQDSSHGGLGSSSTPRSLGSPSLPSISVTPQINLQELPVSLSLPPPSSLSLPPPPSSQSQSLSHQHSHSLSQSLSQSHSLSLSSQQQQQQSGVQSQVPSGLGSHHVAPASGGHVSAVNHLSAHALSSLQQEQQRQQQQAQQQAQQQQQQQHMQAGQPTVVGDDLEIKPGIAEMIREEERAKLLESSHAWLGASTSSIAADYSSLLKLKAPTWTRQELQEAIEAVVTQKMRFTQASSKYGIPKGTLYDNILGKSKRMMVLEEAGLDAQEESQVLEFCCDISLSPYNRRTKKSLSTILQHVEKLRREREPGFAFSGLAGFRWWWAFCKKHGIVSLYFNDSDNDND